MNSSRGKVKYLAAAIILTIFLYVIGRISWGSSSVPQIDSYYRFFSDDYVVPESPASAAKDPLKIYFAESPDSFNKTLSDAIVTKSSATVFVLFFSETDNTTGVPWCPDCRRAKPVIQKALLSSGKSILLVVAMIEKMAYKFNADYPYRVDPRFMLKRIPTLVHIKDGKAEHQLGDKECQVYEIVREFVINSISPS